MILNQSRSTAISITTAFMIFQMSAWDRLDTENDLFVLTGLLFEWLEHLRSPVIGKDAMTYAVIHCDDIEKAMSKVFDFLFNVKLRCFSIL